MTRRMGEKERVRGKEWGYKRKQPMWKVWASHANMETKALIMDEYIIRSRLRICSLCMLCLEIDTRGHHGPLWVPMVVYSQPTRGQRWVLLRLWSMLTETSILKWTEIWFKTISYVLHRWVLIGICGSITWSMIKGILINYSVRDLM